MGCSSRSRTVHLEFGRYRAVQQSVVEGQGDPQHLMLGDGAVVLHHQLILPCS